MYLNESDCIYALSRQRIGSVTCKIFVNFLLIFERVIIWAISYVLKMVQATIAAENNEKPNDQGKQNRLISINFQVFLIIFFTILAEIENEVEKIKDLSRSYTLEEAIQQTSNYSNIFQCKRI